LAGDEGLWVSDGITAQQLGAGRTFTIANSGQLRIGFNYQGAPGFGCTNLSISQFVVHHCEDAAGTTYPCP
jgi:hypothetical protein